MTSEEWFKKQAEALADARGYAFPVLTTEELICLGKAGAILHYLAAKACVRGDSVFAPHMVESIREKR